MTVPVEYQHAAGPGSDGLLIVAGSLLSVGIAWALFECIALLRQEPEHQKSNDDLPTASKKPANTPDPRRWRCFAIATLALFANDLTREMPSTFVSGEAYERFGLSAEFMGAFTGVPSILGNLSPFIASAALHRVPISAFHRLVVALLMASHLALSFAARLEGATAFCFYSLSFRALEGLLLYTSEYVLITLLFRLFHETSTELLTAAAAAVAARGCAVLASAPVGGALYMAGGWAAPHLFVGGWHLIALVVMRWHGEACVDSMAAPPQVRLLEVLSAPGVLVAFASYMSAFVSLSSVATLAQPWLGNAPYEYDSTEIGLLMTALAGGMITAAIVGRLVIGAIGNLSALWVGHALAMVGFLMIGAPPLAFPHINTSKGTVALIASLLGVGIGLILVCIPLLLRRLLANAGLYLASAAVPLGGVAVVAAAVSGAISPFVLSTVVSENGVDVAGVVLAGVQGVALLLSFFALFGAFSLSETGPAHPLEALLLAVLGGILFLFWLLLYCILGPALALLHRLDRALLPDSMDAVAPAHTWVGPLVLALELPLSAVSYALYVLVKTLVIAMVQGRAKQLGNGWTDLLTQFSQDEKWQTLMLVNLCWAPRWNTHTNVHSWMVELETQEEAHHFAVENVKLDGFSWQINWRGGKDGQELLGACSAKLDGPDWLDVPISITQAQAIASGRSDSKQYVNLTLRPYLFDGRRSASLPQLRLEGRELGTGEPLSFHADKLAVNQHLRYKQKLFHLAVQWHSFSLLYARGLLPETTVKAVYLPVGNSETQWLWGVVRAGFMLDVTIAVSVLAEHLVFVTVYNRASVPILYSITCEKTRQLLPICEEDGSFAMRVVRKDGDTTAPAALDGVQLKLVRAPSSPHEAPPHLAGNDTPATEASPLICGAAEAAASASRRCAV